MNSARNNSVELIKLQLFFTPAQGFVYSSLHAHGNFICIKYYPALHVSGSASGSLGKRFFIAQKTLLVCVQNSYQRNFRQVEPFAQ